MSESLCSLFILDVFLNDSPMGSECSAFISSSSHPRFKFSDWSSVGLETFWSELKLNYPIVFCHLEELKSSKSLFRVARDDFEKLLSRHFCVQLSGIMFRHVFSHCHTVYSNTQHNQQKISPRAFYWTRDGLLFSHVIHFIDLNFLAAHIHSQK